MGNNRQPQKTAAGGAPSGGASGGNSSAPAGGETTEGGIDKNLLVGSLASVDAVDVIAYFNSNKEALKNFASLVSQLGGKPIEFEDDMEGDVFWHAIRACVNGPIGVTTPTKHVLPDGSFTDVITLRDLLFKKTHKDGKIIYHGSASSWKLFCGVVAGELKKLPEYGEIKGASGWALRRDKGDLWPLNDQD